MKLSLNWLEHYFVKKPNWDDVLHRLTMAGIELEELKPVAPEFSNIVVGEVLECVKHPKADKLSICKVNVGDPHELLQIVCGAANVKAGVKVPCALLGAKLPNGIVIDTREMRGITSTGMLCSGSEICCDDGVDGLLILASDAVIGQSIRESLNLDDQVAEFKITPNRGDCLSVYGLLREIKSLTNCELKKIEEITVTPDSEAKIKLNIVAKDACPNYVSLVITGASNSVNLPKWLTMRLNRSGIRSISPIVDIANYVMLECGQPLHAFDIDKIGNQVNVRFAHENETIQLLDGKEVNLSDKTLIICDENNTPAAVAGVMGGLNSGVSQSTTNIMLESAFFTPKVIAGASKLYGVSSDAAYRFERGVDPKLQVRAINYAAHLISKFCGGKIGVINQVTNIAQTYNPEISLNYTQINNLIGIAIDKVTIDNILMNLGFEIAAKTEHELIVRAPSFRFDIAIYQDIVEEIARIYGYDNIIPSMPMTQSIVKPVAAHYAKNYLYKTRLVDLAYHEIIGYAFLEDKFEQQLGVKSITPVTLQNPIAGLSVMRTSLVADLIKALLYNVNRGCKSIRIFELARVFHGESELDQKLKLSGLIYGLAYPTNWINPKREVDFFDLKQDVMTLLSEVDNIEFRTYACENDVFHSGRCAKIYINNQEVGILGQLHPKLTQEYGFGDGPYLFELDMDQLSQPSNVLQVIPVSKFPKVERDLSFVVKDGLQVGEILSVIQKSNVKWLHEAKIVDIYSGGTLGAGLKSVSVNFIFSGDKTLMDDEINENMSLITNLVNTKFEARLR